MAGEVNTVLDESTMNVLVHLGRKSHWCRKVELSEPTGFTKSGGAGERKMEKVF